jgi:hypothetical protein
MTFRKNSSSIYHLLLISASERTDQPTIDFSCPAYSVPLRILIFDVGIFASSFGSSIIDIIFTTMNHSKSTAQDAASSNANAHITAQQRRRLRQLQRPYTQLPLSPSHYHTPIPIVLRRRATMGPRMNPQELVRLLDQALAISTELVVATDDHRIVDSSTTTTPKNSTSHPERDSTE